MKEFRRSYFKESSSKSDFRCGSISVWCYRGNIATPKWKDVDTGESHLHNHLFSDTYDDLQIITRCFVL